MKRWLAKIYYRTESGADLVKHEIEELDELGHIVERGPNWDTIIGIEIVKDRAGPFGPLTVSSAKALRAYDLMHLD